MEDSNNSLNDGNYLNRELCIGHIKHLKDHMDLVSKEVRQLSENKEKLAAKGNSMTRRRLAMENHFEQLVRLEANADMDVHPAVLAQLDLPLNCELNSSKKFRDEMIQLRSLMHELLLRTTINEENSHREQSDQEKEFSDKIHDAIRARNLLQNELSESETKLLKMKFERKKIYEEVCLLEQKMSSCQSATWLAVTDSNRLVDHLSLLSKDIIPRPCDPKLKEEKKKAEYRKPILNNNKPMSVSSLSQSSMSIRTEQIMSTTYEDTSVSRDSQMDVRSNGNEKPTGVLPFDLTSALEKILSEAIGEECRLRK